jgi:hypothetical protein
VAFILGSAAPIRRVAGILGADVTGAGTHFPPGRSGTAGTARSTRRVPEEVRQRDAPVTTSDAQGPFCGTRSLRWMAEQPRLPRPKNVVN